MSKVIKKITKPISKGLDKIIPNELKPLLPYAAAFMPYLLPAGGIFSGMVGRGLASAGANAVGQLAQEGNEGELNALSLLLAGGQGALTAPGDASRGIKSASQRLRDMTSRTAIGGEIPGGSMPGQGIGGFKYQMPKDRTFFRKLADFGLEGSANLADKLGTARDTLGGALDLDPTSANFEIIGKAAAAPISQGTGDVLYGEGVKQKKDFDRNEAREAVEAEMRRRGLTQEYIDAVTASMSAYGYTQAEIDEILELQGYELARGGRVGYAMGGDIMEGIMSMIKGGGMDASQSDFDEEYITIMGEDGPIRIKKSDYESMPGMFIDTTTSAYGDAGRGRPVPEFANGGRIGFRMGGGDFTAPDFMSMTEVVENVGGDEMNEGIMQMADMDEGKQFLLNKKYLELLREYTERDLPNADSRALTEANEFVRQINLADGGSVLPQGMEMDYRGGGMIPMGSEERADDVPARVSKNEFVMTADAVRAAGGGSVNKGAQRMYQLMNNLEAKA